VAENAPPLELVVIAGLSRPSRSYILTLSRDVDARDNARA